MKKTFFTITLLLFSLILISCKKDDKEVTHQEIFDSISIGYEVGDSSLSVTKDINLPTETTFEGVTLKWTSANINIISSTGEVTRPSGNNVTVLLILEVTINGIKDEKSFPITVIGTNPVDPVTKFTVTFNSDGGSTVSSVEVLENGLVTKPTNPTKDGFDFVGWFIGDDEWNFSNSVVTKDITLLAKWETAVPTFTVTFNSNGGTLVNSQVIKEGFVVNEPSDPVLTDFDFAGWFVDENLLVVWDFEEDLVTKDITLYAKWTPKVVYYDVLFDSNGGLPVEKITAEENTLVEAPQNPERDGYIFAGWYLNDSLFDFDEDLVTSSITLVASWYPEGVEPGLDTFLVTFETFAGSDIYPAIVADGHLLTEPVEPTLFDNAFEGWYVDEDLLTAWNFDEDLVTKDITLYAKWRTLPPALGTPIHAIVITPSNNYHVAIGPYDQAGNPAVGFGGKFELRFTNTTTSEVFNYEFTHDANVGIGIHAGDWVNSTLSMGTYEVTYRALANNTTHRDSSWYSGSASFEVGPVQIAKPVPVLDENILTWSEVNNASSYNIIVNEVITENVSSPFNLDSLELEAGSYQLTLVAVGGEGYLSSEVIVSFVIKDEDAPNLDTPTNLVFNEDMLTWDEVNNALSYTIYINSQTFNASTNELDLSTLGLNGEFEVRVRANADGVHYLNSELSDAIIVTLESSLVKLSSLSISDFNNLQHHFIDGYAGDQNQRRLMPNTDHEVFNQEGTSGKIKVVVFVDGVAHEAEFTLDGQTTIWYVGFGNTFLPDALGPWSNNSNTYIVHLILVAEEGSGYLDSDPLVTEIKW